MIAFTIPGQPQGSPAFRLLSRCCQVGDCWVPSLSPDPKGYRRIRVHGKKLMAHRLLFEVINGPIAPGMTIDHLCRNTGCCNHAHLEQVTVQENIRRGTQGRKQAQKTHCIRGHEFSEANTYRPPGKNERCCRECMRINGRRNDAKRRAKGRG